MSEAWRHSLPSGPHSEPRYPSILEVQRSLQLNCSDGMEFPNGRLFTPRGDLYYRSIHTHHSPYFMRYFSGVNNIKHFIGHLMFISHLDIYHHLNIHYYKISGVVYMYISYCVCLIIQVYWLNSHLIKPKVWIQLSLASFFDHLSNLLLPQTMYSFAIQDTWFLKVCFLISLCLVNKGRSGSGLMHRFKSEWSLHYLSFGSKCKNFSTLLLNKCNYTRWKSVYDIVISNMKKESAFSILSNISVGDIGVYLDIFSHLNVSVDEKIVNECKYQQTDLGKFSEGDNR